MLSRTTGQNAKYCKEVETLLGHFEIVSSSIISGLILSFQITHFLIYFMLVTIYSSFNYTIQKNHNFSITMTTERSNYCLFILQNQLIYLFRLIY